MGWMNRIKEVFFGKKESEEIDDREKIISVLSSHPIMEELREWASYRSKVLEINDPTKKKMAEYYLGLLFSELRDAVLSAVNNYTVYLSDMTALNNLIIDTINDVRVTAMSQGVPPIFLDKFTNYLYTQEKILASTYRDLDKYEYYNSTIERATFRLDIGFLLVRCVTSEVETVINDMNGELRSALEGSVFETSIR